MTRGPRCWSEWGQVTAEAPTPPLEPPEARPEPAELMALALWGGGRGSGADESPGRHRRPAGGCSSRSDRLRVVAPHGLSGCGNPAHQPWPARLGIAPARLGLTASRRQRYPRPSSTTVPLAIAHGDLDVVLVAGAEALFPRAGRAAASAAKELEERCSQMSAMVQALENNLEEKRQLISSKENGAKELELALQESLAAAKTAERELNEQRLLAASASELEERCAHMAARVEALERDLENKYQLISAKEKESKELELILQESLKVAKATESELDEQLLLVATAKKQVKALENDLEMKRLLISAKEKESTELELALKESQNVAMATENEQRRLAATAKELEEKYLNITARAGELESDLEEKRQLLNAKETAIAGKEQLERKVAELLEHVSILETGLKKKDQELAARYTFEIEQLKLDLTDEKSYTTTLYSALNESLAKYEAEEKHARELFAKTSEQQEALARREKEMQHMIDQYALANGDLLSQITEIRQILDQEKALNEELSAKLQKVAPENTISALE